MRIVKPAGQGSTASRRLTSHGSEAEKRLLSGRGALIRWNVNRVKVTGEKPSTNARRNRP